MDVDCYRLAYNTFYRNWQRFGIPEKDIPFPKTETIESLNAIIPGFSKAVVFFQITSRSDLKTYFDESPRVINLSDFCTRFEIVMKKVFPERFVLIQDPLKDGHKKGLSDVAMKEDQSEDTMETDLSEDATEEDLSEDNKRESLPKDSENVSLTKNGKKESLTKDSKKESLTKDSKKESLHKDSKKESHSVKEDISEVTMETDVSDNTAEEDLSDDSKKESLPEDSKKECQTEDNMIKAEEVPQIIAFSLAVCTELILYQYEDNKKYMQNLPDLWMKYFNENLKDLCDEAGCDLEMLKDYSESIRCPDNFLNKFVDENRNDYHQIEAKFRDYLQKNYAVESPEHSRFFIEVRSFPKELCFARMKAQFCAIVESCKSVRGKAADEAPLLDDYSPV